MTRWRHGVWALCAGLLAATPLTAQVPEPETIFYGRIINRTSGQEYQLSAGRVEWSILGGGAAPVDVSAQLGSLQEGRYSYVLRVPHQAKSLDLKVDAGLLPLRSTDADFDTTNIRVNGKRAFPIGGSLQFVASQPKRGGVYRLDLEVFDMLADTDGDGMPDWWEDLHGFDKEWAGDAMLRFGNNRYTNLEAFRLGLDPRRDDRAPQLLTSELSVMSGGVTGLLLRTVASTTAAAQIVYRLTVPPSGGSVVLSNARPDSKRPDRTLKAGESFTQADVDAGLVKFLHSDPTILETTLSLQITALNQPAQELSSEVALYTYKPEPAEGRAGVRWANKGPDSGVPEKGTAFDLWRMRATSAFAEDWAGAEGEREDIAGLLLSRWFDFTVWDGRLELPSRNLAVPSAGLTPKEYKAGYVKQFGRAKGHVLFAGGGAVRIEGGMSSDILFAGTGSTTLRGNLGADMFVARRNQTLLEDFNPGEGDVLDLSDLLHGVAGELRERVQVAASGNDTTLRIPLNADEAAVVILRGIRKASVDLEKWRRSGKVFTGDLTNVAVPENRAPQAVSDEGYVVAGAPVTIAVLANDLDPDGDALTLVSATVGSVGRTEVIGDNIVYTPGPGFVGQDRFTYTISDGRDGVAVGEVRITYPYPAAAGSYAPIILSPDGEPIGRMSVGLLSSGAATVKLTLGGINFVGRVEFDENGVAEVPLRAGSRSLTARLQIDLADPSYPLTGQIVEGDSVLSLIETVAVANPKNKLPAKVQFTAALHMPEGELSGHGFATVSLARNSSARIVGQLGDGTPFSASTTQRRDGSVTWTTPLYKGAGWILGNWALVQKPGASLGGSTRWVYKAATTEFDRLLPTEASLYVAPSVATVSAWEFSDPLGRLANVSFYEGGLSQRLDILVSFAREDKIQTPAESPLRLKFNRKNGLFSGTLQTESTRKQVRGVFLQNRNRGFGYFLEGTVSGAVELTPQ